MLTIYLSIYLPWKRLFLSSWDLCLSVPTKPVVFQWLCTTAPGPFQVLLHTQLTTSHYHQRLPAVHQTTHNTLLLAASPLMVELWRNPMFLTHWREVEKKETSVMTLAVFNFHFSSCICSHKNLSDTYSTFWSPSSSIPSTHSLTFPLIKSSHCGVGDRHILHGAQLHITEGWRKEHRLVIQNLFLQVIVNNEHWWCVHTNGRMDTDNKAFELLLICFQPGMVTSLHPGQSVSLLYDMYKTTDNFPCSQWADTLCSVSTWWTASVWCCCARFVIYEWL